MSINANPERLTNLARDLLVRGGAPAAESQVVADHLVEANLKGHDSHGVGMLPHYVRNIEKGFCEPGNHASLKEQGATLVVDGQFGFGQVVGPEAMQFGIEAAKEHGVAVIGLKNAHHLGRIGHHAEVVARAGLISMHYVNVVGHPPQVAPFGGREKRLSTNPFCCAIPVEGSPPVILDMATSAIAAGKVRVARNAGLQVPDDCLIDADGNPTTDPNIVLVDPPGAQVHFGKHKGFGLAVICEILAGALIGNWTMEPGNPRHGTTVNHMLTVILTPERLANTAGFAQETRRLIRYLKDTPTAPGAMEVLIPGEPERQSEQARRQQGIPIDDGTFQGLMELAEHVGVARKDVDKVVLASG